MFVFVSGGDIVFCVLGLEWKFKCLVNCEGISRYCGVVLV